MRKGEGVERNGWDDGEQGHELDALFAIVMSFVGQFSTGQSLLDLRRVNVGREVFLCYMYHVLNVWCYFCVWDVWLIYLFRLLFPALPPTR